MNAVSLGPKPALHDRGGTLSWSELDKRANQVAGALAAADLGGENLVGTLVRNGREIVEVLLGAQKMGAVVCPLSTWARPAELRTTLNQSNLRLLVYEHRHYTQIEDADLESVTPVVVGDSPVPPGGPVQYEAWLAQQGSTAPTPFTRNRGGARIVIHTSGTTGKPKGAARSLSGLREFVALLDVIPLRRDDVILCAAPLFHSFGLLTFALATFLGATLILPETFEPEQCLALIEKHGATATALVPVMIHRIVSLPDEVKSRYDHSSLRVLLSSGSAIPTDLRGSAFRLFGDVLYDLYGSTEAGWVAIATPEDHARRPGTSGRPVPGVEVAVFSRDGERLLPGATGELHVRSGAVFEGYASGEDTRERAGFLSLGDMGRLGQDGFLYVEGRADDMVVIGGENVYPAEVEEVIRRLDGVEDVAAFGVDDPEYGQVLVAFVVGSANERRVMEACERELASFKVPRRVKRVPELPRTSTGKVLKRELLA